MHLKKFLPFILIVLITMPACWALVHPGYFGASDDLHIGWLFEMDKVVKLGQFPPRFVPDLSYGFGYPLFNFVFPFPFYLLEILHLLGTNLVDSIKLLFALGLMASGLSMYILMSELATPAVAIFAATVYVYTPYRSTDIYVRGAVGEALAFVFLPIVFWAILKLRTQSKYIIVGGLAVAGLILSHNISAYMFMPFALLWGLLVLQLTQLKKILFLFTLGLVLSAYFWVPAIWDSRLMAYSTVFQYWDHFPTLKQLFLPYWGYGASVPGPYDGMSFFMGYMNILGLILAMLGSIFLHGKLSKVHRMTLVWVVISSGIAIGLMNFRSMDIWKVVPLLPYFQFPWRFLIITSFSSCLAFLVLGYIPKGKWAAILLTLATVMVSVNYFHPHDFLERTDVYYINRYIPVPTASSEYRGLQEEYLRLPKATEFRPQKTSPLVTDSQGNVIYPGIPGELNSKFTTSLPTATNLSYNKYNFPGWRVEIDGLSTAIKSGRPFGQITFDVPAGEHKISVAFGETGEKILLDLTSLIALGISLFWYLRHK